MILEMNHIWLFLILLPLVALLYASVGHGGASGYLALMALFSFSPEMMKPTALLLNLFVAGIAFYHYYKASIQVDNHIHNLYLENNHYQKDPLL